MLVFKNFPRSKKFRVFFGRIEIIHPSFFEKMDELSELQMIKATIIYINPYSSRWNNSLHTLDFNSNFINHIDVNTFRGLDKLQYLDLSNNRILRYLSLTLPNLKVLNISNTEVVRSYQFDLPNLIIFTFSKRLADPHTTSNFFENLNSSKCDLLKEVNVSKSNIQLHEIWDANKKISFFNGL